jgi:hypothetical protein
VEVVRASIPDVLILEPKVNGNEADLLPEHGAGLYAVDVKAGATVASDYFTGLQRLCALLAGRITAGAVVYGGDSAQPRSRFQVVPAFSCDRLFSGWLNGRPPRARKID